MWSRSKLKHLLLGLVFDGPNGALEWISYILYSSVYNHHGTVQLLITVVTSITMVIMYSKGDLLYLYVHHGVRGQNVDTGQSWSCHINCHSMGSCTHSKVVYFLPQEVVRSLKSQRLTEKQQ